ncbi:MAG: carbohydrate-binding protein, partial [Bacteroidota bacterium]|nr:carbohydrate-binding protein [Bacteroidota bacterium]
MKYLKNNPVNGHLLPTGRSLFISFLVAAAFFFTGCEKDLLNFNDFMVHSNSSSQNASVSTTGTYEAEQAVLNGAVVTTNQPGYTGTGFVDYVHATGDFIEWTVNATAAGSFLLEFRYANGGTANRPLQLQVNGTVVSASLAFSPTGSWSSWSLSSSSVANLTAGTNKIRLTTIGSNGPNIDHLVVEAAVSQSGTLEAEQALLNGAVVNTNQTGYTGTGFADYVHASGDFIEWTVNATTAGSFLLQFRYANGGTANRSLQLQVNGKVMATSLAFSPTGGWASWSVSSTTVDLMAGANKVRLTTIGSNGPNIDNLNFSIGSTKHLLYLVDNGFNKLLFLNQKDPSKSWT